MRPSRFFVSTCCGAMLATAAFAADEAPRIHSSTATSDPQPAATADEEAFRVERNTIATPEWQAVIKRAKNHQDGRGYYTLMRVLVDDASPEEKIQAQATKLKELTEEYYGGGGKYRVIQNGGFLLLEHINSSRRSNGRDPVTLGALSHGRTKLWVDVPPPGVLGVLGDVVLTPCATENMGALAIRFDAPKTVHGARLTIGPVVVGGPYGKTYVVDTSREFQLPLPAGDYKILLPDFDVRNSRWNVQIEARKTTRLTFDVTWQVAKTDEAKAPYKPKVEARVSAQQTTMPNEALLNDTQKGSADAP